MENTMEFDVSEELRRTFESFVQSNDDLLYHRTSFSSGGRSPCHPHPGEIGVSCGQPQKAILQESTRRTLCTESEADDDDKIFMMAEAFFRKYLRASQAKFQHDLEVMIEAILELFSCDNAVANLFKRAYKRGEI